MYHRLVTSADLPLLQPAGGVRKRLETPPARRGWRQTGREAGWPGKVGKYLSLPHP